MAESTPQAHSLPEQHPERHEHTDIGIRPLAIFAVVVIVLAVAIHLGLYGLMGLFNVISPEPQKQRPRSAVPFAQQAPEPRIQGVPGYHADMPREDMAALTARFTEQLNASGPANEPGFRRIPIDRAMRLLVQNGLPAAPPATPATQGGANAQ